MQRHRQRKRADPLTINVNDATGCQSMAISWDASSGKAPWTVMIAPVNQVPYTMSVASASGSNFVANWAVPKISDDAQALVAVADSTGTSSGVSSFITLHAGTGSCAAMSDSLDFVWFPTKDVTSPDQCNDWGITWQQDRGNNGVQGQVTFTFLPEKGQPVTTVAGTGDKGSFKWAIPFDQSTRFLAIGNDGGKAGTGGVGDLYSVSSSGTSKTCKAVGVFGNGLPTASAALSGATSSAAASTSSKAGKTSAAASSTATRKSGTQANPTAPSSSSDGEKHNTAGTAVGATFGVLGALALIGVLIWWWRRRRNNEERKVWGGAPISGGAKQSGQGGDIGYPVSPWRWSASPYEPPQTTSRTSKWLSRASGTAATGFRVMGRGGQNDGHGRSGSMTTGAQPTMQQAAFRNMSVPEDDYALSSIPRSDAYPQSPSPPRSQHAGVGAQSVHSTVPDTALFPPPQPSSMAMYDDGGYGVASRQAQSSQYQQQYQHQQQYQQQQSPFADPSPANSYAPLDSPLSEVRQGTSFSAPPPNNTHGGGTGRNLMAPMPPSKMDYIGPIGPTKTSIYDPYTHMSQVYDDQDGSMAERIQQAGAGSYGTNDRQRYANPGETVSSEVMMPSDRDRFASHFAKTGPSSARKPVATDAHDDDEDGGLPYL